MMVTLSHVPVGALSLERFGSVLPPEDYERFLRTVLRGREVFGWRVVWNVNWTARGGGVAEMLVSLLGDARGTGIDSRWVVISGNEDFFVVTKRIHNFGLSSPFGGDPDRQDFESSCYRAPLLTPQAAHKMRTSVHAHSAGHPWPPGDPLTQAASNPGSRGHGRQRVLANHLLRSTIARREHRGRGGHGARGSRRRCSAKGAGAGTTVS